MVSSALGRGAWRRVARQAFLAGGAALWLMAATAAGARAGGETRPGGAHARPERLAVHWNDAADTLQTLRAGGDRPLRLTVTIAGADTLQGYTVTLRLLPLGTEAPAWSFADSGDCAAATWSVTADEDSMAPAPWKNKLSVSDLRRASDGTVWMMVSTAFDLAVLRPEATYSLFHLDLFPPVALGEGGACPPGWDSGIRAYVEMAEVLLNDAEGNYQIHELTDLGRSVRFEPLPGTPAKPAPGGPR